MKPDKARHRLFVEGPSDAAVVNKLVLLNLHVDLATPESHRIVMASSEEGGFDQALARFRDALIARRPERLGLVVDRDNLDGKPDRWEAVRAVLEEFELNPPVQPPSTGIRIETPWDSRVGTWLMPDNVNAGDLEVFLESLLPPQPQTWEYAGEVVTRARELGARYRELHRGKARFHTWLAWQDPPGIPYGTAIAAKVLGQTSTSAAEFVSWFDWLFGT